MGRNPQLNFTLDFPGTSFGSGEDDARTLQGTTPIVMDPLTRLFDSFTRWTDSKIIFKIISLRHFI